ncbi:hypothetical protein LJC45_00330 [Alistipes sp. OttesenSCG-928-B03]|nr:hypothetical protein [Alistipes sp. OttesenSCG-928-B03]
MKNAIIISIAILAVSCATPSFQSVTGTYVDYCFLTLNRDSTFVYKSPAGLNSFHATGKWVLSGKCLTLNSDLQPHSDHNAIPKAQSAWPEKVPNFLHTDQTNVFQKDDSALSQTDTLAAVLHKLEFDNNFIPDREEGVIKFDAHRGYDFGSEAYLKELKMNYYRYFTDEILRVRGDKLIWKPAKQHHKYILRKTTMRAD